MARTSVFLPRYENEELRAITIKTGDLRQVGNDVLSHAIGEVALLRVIGEVVAGKYSDRGLVGKSEGHLGQISGLYVWFLFLPPPYAAAYDDN